TETDPNAANNTNIAESTTVNAAQPQADLVVTQSDSPDPATVSENATYRDTVKNNGADSATKVTLTDALPAGVTFVSATGAVTPVGGVLTFNLGTVPSTQTASVTVVVQPTAAASITNTASATATETDPNTANNTNIAESTTVNAAQPQANLVVTQSDSPDPAT